MKKILLYHLFSNGDCLYATVIARQIKKDYKGCHLTWVIASNCKSMIENNPFVDEIIEININPNEDKETVYNENLSLFNLKKLKGIYDEVFATQIIGDAFSSYDGCLTTSIFRGYGKPNSVGYKPTLILTDKEIKKAQDFVIQNNLAHYKHLILFECAPLSGQMNFTFEFIKDFSVLISSIKGVAVILSSAKKIPIEHEGFFDGSVLSIRETVALSKHCSFLLGCSSGITWATTSVEDRQIPLVQILDKNAYVFNPPSIAFEKAGKSTDEIIELYNIDVMQLIFCFKDIFSNGFIYARNKYNQKRPENFRIYRGITHYLIRKGKFNKLLLFIKINLSEHGFNIKMITAIVKGIVLFPAQFFLNLISRKK